MYASVKHALGDLGAHHNGPGWCRFNFKMEVPSTEEESYEWLIVGARMFSPPPTGLGLSFPEWTEEGRNCAARLLDFGSTSNFGSNYLSDGDQKVLNKLEKLLRWPDDGVPVLGVSEYYPTEEYWFWDINNSELRRHRRIVYRNVG